MCVKQNFVHPPCVIPRTSFFSGHYFVGLPPTYPLFLSFARAHLLPTASGDETSDALSSQAQSPAVDVPELDILDEDAMLAVFRERALISMQGN